MFVGLACAVVAFARVNKVLLRANQASILSGLRLVLAREAGTRRVKAVKLRCDALKRASAGGRAAGWQLPDEACRPKGGR